MTMHNGQNFIYAHTQSMAFTAPIFLEIQNYSMPVTWGSVRSSSKSAKTYRQYGWKLIHALTSRMTATEPIFTKIKFSKLPVRKDISDDKIFAKQLTKFVRSISGYVLRTVQVRFSRRKVLHSAYLLGVGSSTDITIFQATTWLQTAHPYNLRVTGTAFSKKILWYALLITNASSQ